MNKNINNIQHFNINNMEKSPIIINKSKDKETEIFINNAKYLASEIKRLSFKTYSSFDPKYISYHFGNGLSFTEYELQKL